MLVMPFVFAKGEFVTGATAAFDCFGEGLAALVWFCSLHELSRSTATIAMAAEINAVIHHRSGGLLR
jgi:hypothetical protein